VTNTLDDGSAGSLRAAIGQANTTVGTNTVTFAPGVSGTITLTGGELLIGHNLTISGPGASQLAVSGNYASRVFEVASGVTTSLSGLTVENGNGGDNGGGAIHNYGTLMVSNSTLASNYGYSGGAIFNEGTLTVSNSTLSNNSASVGGNGGAIFNGGTLTISNSTFTGNSALSGGGISSYAKLTVSNSTFVGNRADSGGAIFNGGTLTVNRCTLAGNSALGHNGVGAGIGVGGGIYSTSYSLTVADSTLSGNSADYGGGIYYFPGGGPNLLANDTIAANRANAQASGGQGGGIYIWSDAFGPLTLNNTIVAGNFNGASASTIADDIAGTVNSASAYNLIGTGGSGGLQNGANGNQVGVANPGLAPLSDNGGPTQTMALLPGSPAIDAGSNALAVDANGTPLGTDQRGLPRIVGGTVDIGAFEFSSQLSATASGLVYSRATGLFSGTLTLTNTGSTALTGQLKVLLTGLPAGVTLANASGSAADGTPYILVSLPNNTLAPGASITFGVQFRNPNRLSFQYAISAVDEPTGN
jgi:hypothetical protein